MPQPGDARPFKINSVFASLRDWRFARYLVASVGALAVDFAAFLGLMTIGMNAVGASALGYVLGIAAHWFLSSRTVFTDGVANRGAVRTRQKMLFAGSALAGLVLTTGIIAVGEAATVHPVLAKCIAVAVSFVVTYFLRALVVFRPQGSTA